MFLFSQKKHHPHLNFSGEMLLQPVISVVSKGDPHGIFVAGNFGLPNSWASDRPILGFATVVEKEGSSYRVI